jgi:hypothetical protein
MKIDTPFSPGFRISKSDMLVLLVGSVAAIVAVGIDLQLGLILVFVVGHFFLFCNVIRMARRLELIWAAVFLSLAGSSIVLNAPAWWITFSASLACTAVLVLVQMRQPSYHGVLWQRINPNLRRWWQLHGGGRR